MLTAICVDTGQKAYAFEAEKRHHHTCPECINPVSLKPGNVRVAHFAHRPGSTCTYRGGESEEHRRLKHSIFQHLKDQWSNSLSFIDLEYRLNDRSRPDIFLQTKRGTQIAIEVQLSALSVPEISHRTRCLSEAGVYVLWIIPFEVNRFLCRCTRTNEVVTRPKVKLKE